MINYRTRKIRIAMTILSGFFLIRGFFWMSDICRQIENDGVPIQNLYMQYLSDSYFGILEQVAFGTILIALTIEYVIDKDESIFLIRHLNRDNYLSARLRMLVGICGGMIFCKFVIGLAILYYGFGSELLFTIDTLKFTLAGILIFTIYSIRCGIIYMIIRDALNSKALAMGLTVVIYFATFYIWLDNLLHPLLTVRWMPFLDLASASKLYAGEQTGFEFVLATIRQFTITMVYSLIWSRTWRCKDVIGLEK